MILKYLGIHLKSKMQYKVSFILNVMSQISLVLVSLVTIYSLFDNFGSIKDFTLYEALISFSVVFLGYSFAEIFGRGFDSFKRLIKSGTFDLLLIKPRNIYLQIIGSNIGYEKIGRAIGALGILVYSVYKVDTLIDPFKLMLLIPMVFASSIIFISIFIIGAAFTFYTIEGLEVVNIISDGSKTAGQYPIGIFNKYFVIFFTFVIPIACVNYYPVIYMLGKSNNIIYALSPILSLIIIVPAVCIFNHGLKNYQGTGS